MKKKIIKISIAMVLIGLLINVTVFAEPLNKTLDYKYRQEEDINREIFQIPSIISRTQADTLARREVFIVAKDSLNYLLSGYREMIRGREANGLVEYHGRPIGDLLKSIEKKQASLYVYLNHSLTYVCDWDGKDRIISLDLDEDNDTFIFLN